MITHPFFLSHSIKCTIFSNHVPGALSSVQGYVKVSKEAKSRRTASQGLASNKRISWGTLFAPTKSSSDERGQMPMKLASLIAAQAARFVSTALLGFGSR